MQIEHFLIYFSHNNCIYIYTVYLITCFNMPVSTGTTSTLYIPSLLTSAPYIKRSFIAFKYCLSVSQFRLCVSSPVLMSAL